MIDLYTWTTPNGRKVSILLEELGIDYTCHAVDINKGQQHEPAFLKVSPNNRIPAIYDHEAGLAVMESGAILLYLAQKHGRFLCEGPAYWSMMEWLMWQMGGLGPMLGQVHHFHKYNPGIAPYAEDRFRTEAARLYRVLDTRLQGRDFIAGEGRGSYSIADMAAWPWISRFEWQSMDLNDFPAVRDWYLRIAERPATERGYNKPHFVNPMPMP